MTQKKRMYVLDTNVLMHDPTALFRFEEHDIFLPMTVLEELDKNKKGTTEGARNSRQVTRFLSELVESSKVRELSKGVKLERPNAIQLNVAKPSGRLFFQDEPNDNTGQFGYVTADNQILAATLSLIERHPTVTVVLVSKDINLRIKAQVHNISAEDYENDRALDDLNLLYTGALALPETFWDRRGKVKSWTDRGRTFYTVKRKPTDQWHPNQLLYIDQEGGVELRVVTVNEVEATLQVVDDYRRHQQVWGVLARNREQNFALNLLMDPDVDFVTLLGTAGTGKTLLTLAAGLAQSLDTQRYKEIVVTRATVPVGEDIGFLPGTEEEKMNPWMGALEDNLEVLAAPREGGSWGRAATNDFVMNRIKIRSMNFMRGRTFLNRYLIIDEAQNLTPKQMKTLITRAGPNSKVICLGNVEQIDTPYLTETTSGLTFIVDRFKNWPHGGHITLRRGERSRLADFASEVL